MRRTLTYSIEVDDGVDVEAFVDAGDKALAAAGATVFSTGVASQDAPYTVIGVIKGKPAERWNAVVEAGSIDEAEAKAVAEDEANPRVVAGVTRGAVEIEHADPS